MSEMLPDGYAMHQWEDVEVERFWNFVSQVQQDQYFSHSAGKQIAWFYRDLIRQAGNILDYGCGTGRFLEEILRYGTPAAGFDSSARSRAAAVERLSGIQLSSGVFGASDLEQMKGSFDLVFCLEVVEHLEDGVLSAVLTQIYDLLRKGGRVVITTPNEEDLSASWVCSPESGQVFHRWQHVRSWTSAALIATVESAGFRVDRTLQLNVSAIGRTIGAVSRRFAFATVARRQPQNLFLTATKE